MNGTENAFQLTLAPPYLIRLLETLCLEVSVQLDRLVGGVAPPLALLLLPPREQDASWDLGFRVVGFEYRALFVAFLDHDGCELRDDAHLWGETGEASQNKPKTQ